MLFAAETIMVVGLRTGRDHSRLHQSSSAKPISHDCDAIYNSQPREGREGYLVLWFDDYSISMSRAM